MTPKRVLILSSSTGGGHNMRARAFESWAARDPVHTWKTQTHQALESTHAFYKMGVHIYNLIQKQAPFLHHIYFNQLEWMGLFQNRQWIMGQLSFQNLIRHLEPHLLISVHGSTNHGFFDLAREAIGPQNLRCITYCGELSGGYGFSRHWVNPEADLFVGAVPETVEAAASLGMPSQKCLNGGFLLRPEFYTPRASSSHRASLAKELGLDPDQFILLLSTGANSANNHPYFLQALQQSGLSLQVIVLCGSNERLRYEIATHSDRWPSLTISPLGRREDMSALMDLADAIVARPGTGTVSEAIVRQCPLVLNGLGGIMPQEYITVKFCRKHGLGEVATDARQFIRTIRRFLENPQALTHVRSQMQKVRPRFEPLKLLETLHAL